MKVIDKNGCVLTIEDLDAAIQTTAEYKEYRHEDSTFHDFDQRMRAYWSHLHRKLVRIQKDQQKIITIKSNDNEKASK